MTEFNEYDEDELWDSGKFFTLDELLDDSEGEERDTNEPTLSEKERKELFQEIHDDFLTEDERDELVRDSIKKLSSKSVDSLAKKESEKKTIDPDEVHRLYFDENWTMKDIAVQYGYKTCTPIMHMFREQGWKSRQQDTLEIDIDPEEVHRLYFEEGLTLKEVGERLGYKSQSPIRRIFEEQGWETKKRWKELDYDRVRELYFEQKMSMEKVAKEMGLSCHYPIVCIFQEQGWKFRPSRTKKVEIDPEEVYSLYFKEGLTQLEIAERYGYKSSGAIMRIFRENDWKPIRSDIIDDINFEEVCMLYYDEQLNLTEVARKLSVTTYTLKKVFKKMDWKMRGQKHDTLEEREESNKEAEKRYLEKIRVIRDELFGTECEICGEEREIIHRKDGMKHSPYLLHSLKGLRSLVPSEWAPVCKSCHLDVHALMRVKTFEWNSIKKLLREAS